MVYEKKEGELEMEKILITGISGFIGEKLAQRAIKEGYEVGGIIRQHPQEPESIKNLRGKAHLYEGDVTDKTRLGNIIRDFNPEYIVHLAALTRVSYSFGHEEETFQTNAGGTINMVTAARKHGTNLKKFIFASSMEAYGHKPENLLKNIPFDEKTNFGVGSPYAVWKICGDYFVRQQCYANAFPGIVLRQTNTYGRTYDDYFVVEAFVTSMLKNKKEVNFGNPKPIRNFIYIDDLIDLYLTLFKTNNKDVIGNAFTVGPPNGITIGDLAILIANKLKWKGKINWYTREIRDGEIYYLNSSNKKVTQVTGWSPQTSLSSGLDKTIEYWKNKQEI